MKSLIDTIRLVALRKNVVKLALYKHFRNTLIFAILGQFSSVSETIADRCVADECVIFIIV